MTERVVSCECGCGAAAPIAKRTNRKLGHVKGQPVRFVCGHHRRNGGLSLDRESGRWRIVCRDGSMTYFYRAVMEAHLGRKLLPTEEVHHRNENPGDDRLENLELLAPSTHGALHAPAAQAARAAQWLYRWSRRHPDCRECGTTDDPHYADGFCRRCYHRLYMRSRRALAATP